MSHSATGRPILACVVGLCALLPLGVAWHHARANYAGRIYARYYLRTSQVTDTSGAYRKWSTPRGDYWTLKASGGTLLQGITDAPDDGEGERVHPGDIVLDCGAHQGVFVRQALDAGAARVIAIEPVPENLECLRRTFRHEINAGAVEVYASGVWDSEQVLRLAPAGEQQVLRVPLTTIDRVVAELKLPRVDFIRVDVDGALEQSLGGAERTMARFHPRLSLCGAGAENAPAAPKMVRALVPGFAFDQACTSEFDTMALLY